MLRLQERVKVAEVLAEELQFRVADAEVQGFWCMPISSNICPRHSMLFRLILFASCCFDCLGGPPSVLHIF